MTIEETAATERGERQLSAEEIRAYVLEGPAPRRGCATFCRWELATQPGERPRIWRCRDCAGIACSMFPTRRALAEIVK